MEIETVFELTQNFGTVLDWFCCISMALTFQQIERLNQINTFFIFNHSICSPITNLLHSSVSLDLFFVIFADCVFGSTHDDVTFFAGLLMSRGTRGLVFFYFFCLPLFFKTTSRPETCVAVWFRFAIKVTPIRYDLVFTYILGVFDNFWHERLWLYANYRN